MHCQSRQKLNSKCTVLGYAADKTPLLTNNFPHLLNFYYNFLTTFFIYVSHWRY